MLRHDPMKRLMAMQPPDPAMAQWWQRVCATLSQEIGFAFDKQTDVMTVPTDTDIEGRAGEPVKDVIQNLTASGELGDNIEYNTRPGVPAKDIVQRIGNTGTALDTRLLPVSKTGNLGCVISPSPLSATDEGADTKITIDAATPEFDFGPLNTAGAEITGIPHNTRGDVYFTGFSYDDGSYTDALFTTDARDLVDNPRNLYVGTITTPDTGQPPTGGGGGGGNYEP